MANMFNPRNNSYGFQQMEWKVTQEAMSGANKHASQGSSKKLTVIVCSVFAALIVLGLVLHLLH